MYGPLRDIFIHVLGYPATDVDIDTTGEGGRPDVTARAPSGVYDAKRKPIKIDWIVLEAKDERGCFVNPRTREEIFSKKSKYIGSNTAWFVMVDPEVIIARQVTGSDFSQANDIEVSLDGLIKPDFLNRFDQLKYAYAGVPMQLKRFREGDTRLIATEKLTNPDPTNSNRRDLNRYQVSRKRFFTSVREITMHLQNATRHTLTEAWPELERYQKLANDFGETYKGREKGRSWRFDPHLLTIAAKPQGLEAAHQHDKDALALRNEFKKRPHLARLALDGLPNFQSRTGAKDENLAELFSIETANLILARILLLRFFEDNGFFGELKYVCNGGVKAFQQMREYFRASYTGLLELAYRHASQFYAAAFEETELDWVLGINDQGLSNAIEWAMYQLSRYDFTTIKGDILTGIYDRFMDRNQRKALGEFYTPPSIARYIIKRSGVSRTSRVIDPACGSGTFLIESYRTMVGDDIERGAAEYSDALDALKRIAGNDLNTFSSVLAQIQLLWQVLGMRQDVEAHGFPELMVTGKVNSLLVNQITELDRFGELSQPIYDAVIGNPPYVRAERSAQDLDDTSAHYFEGPTDLHKGISAKHNAYTLFIYKALSSWCRPLDENGIAGKLGFIIPVSLFDANGTEDLRRLFQVGGRWTLREIIDLEIIYKQVFDADVLPAIIIAENRPATEEDFVSIRLANHECVKPEAGGALPSFNLEELPEQLIPYPDLFTPDGRIMTRLTSKRLEVIKKLWRNSTLRDAAKTYWQGRSKAAKGKVTDQKPEVDDLHNWAERKMIAGGIAFRNEKAEGENGHAVYKGENIISAELQGVPAAKGVNLATVSDNSLWSSSEILPESGFAAAQVAHCVNMVRFNPKDTAFTNTATLFFPRPDLEMFPFDLIFLSNIYIFHYAFAARMGILRTLRSHIYPTNLGLMPWNDALNDLGEEVENLRLPLLDVCQRRFQARDALKAVLTGLKLPTLKDHLRYDKASHISWAECFDDHQYEVDITSLRIEERCPDEIMVHFNDVLLEYVELNRRDLADGLVRALSQLKGESLSKGKILNLPIPVTVEEQQRWADILTEHGEENLAAQMVAELDKLDRLIGPALGLDQDDIDFIQSELTSDPFLKGIRPRYPGTETRKQGFRTGLNSSTRYQ